MIQEHDIREQLARYLSGRCSLASLERWLNSANIPLVVDRSDYGFRLLAKVSLAIDEHHDHVTSDSQFRAELTELVNDIVVSHPVELPHFRPVGQFVSSSVNQRLFVPARAIA